MAALQRIGCQLKRETRSHKTLARDGWPDYIFSFDDPVQWHLRVLHQPRLPAHLFARWLTGVAGAGAETAGAGWR
jgi:hypothetical protein